jgi:tetratricopeptide (TPR) repeat protein
MMNVNCAYLRLFVGLGFLLLFSGCSSVSYQTSGKVQRGRTALLYGDPNAALNNFQSVAASNPNYLLDFAILPEGVWTYVGRSYYAIGKLPEAQQALEKAVSLHKQDNMAKLYLGLVLAREGDKPRGLKEIGAGLRGLENWLDYVDRYTTEGSYWDPGNYLRMGIQRNLAMIEGEDINLTAIVASGEQLGREFEQEIDAALDQFKDAIGDGDDSRG